MMFDPEAARFIPWLSIGTTKLPRACRTAPLSDSFKLRWPKDKGQRKRASFRRMRLSSDKNLGNKTASSRILTDELPARGRALKTLQLLRPTRKDGLAMKKLLALAVVSGFFALGCNNPTTPATKPANKTTPPASSHMEPSKSAPTTPPSTPAPTAPKDNKDNKNP
jgi:hypothetical protein